MFRKKTMLNQCPQSVIIIETKGKHEYPNKTAVPESELKPILIITSKKA
jgi:hypothetical protein